jgi:hypothetical protein
MCATMPVPSSHQLASLHDKFLALLPKIELHGRIYFRHLKPHKKEEVLQEMRSLAWLWYVRLANRGKDAVEFITPFNKYLARAINNGSRVMGREKAKDVMNQRTQKRHGFQVESLSSPDNASFSTRYSAVHGQKDQDAFEDRLHDNTVTPVPDQAAFRIDWRTWMKTRTERDRRIIEDLMAGHRTLDVSRKYGMSPGRVSQLRGEFHDDWERFCSVPESEDQEVAA